MVTGMAKKRKYGHWIGKREDAYCSICNKDAPMFVVGWKHNRYKTPYCPHCGSYMWSNGKTGDMNG